jgi:hydrogenase maturation protein HypF
LSSGNADHIIALLISIDGLVQGVGFRPFVYRLAQQYHMNGWVVNRTDGVTLKVEGLAQDMSFFLEDLRYKAPVVSQINEMTIDQDYPEGLHGFFILASQDLVDETSEISPDIAVCPECLEDLRHQPHRKGYPLINCTNCGPRFTIVRSFPYDRKNTTMASFPMCPDCSNEYADVADRRFHAQPVACNHCGPRYQMLQGATMFTGTEEILENTVDLIIRGGLIAVKGTGGFHLMCDALNEEAVSRLRKLKKREGKPFAVMFRDLESIERYAAVSDTEASALTSWRRPIVVLKTHHPLASGVSLGLDTLGAFLPYMPMHHLIFEKAGIPALVLTSGNLAEEPVIISNEEALGILGPITDAIITYNRDIHNRNDDSVVRVVADKERVLRRSRGYVPAPVKLNLEVDGWLATGAELSNCFCVGKSDRAYLSQHIGDLKNQETFAFFEESLERFQKLFRIKVKAVASDLHPDYRTTRFACNTGLPVVEVQHHHAHIASCMAENGLDEMVIGLAFDGTGYGTDGAIWGSEFLVCDYRGSTRKAHFDYMALPGGDRASQEPWRMGLSLLYQAYGRDLLSLELPLLRHMDKALVTTLVEAMEKRINCPMGSGAGRVFDGVAAITGICERALFHAEAPMRLESCIVPGIDEYYDFNLSDTLSFVPAIRQICDSLSKGEPLGVISARFHNTVAEASCRMVKKISKETGLHKIVLSGGTFQNKYLSETLENRLVKDNFAVFTHSRVPCNDGGLALGQLVVAAGRKGRGTGDMEDKYE